jgi:hypothetical protein
VPGLSIALPAIPGRAAAPEGFAFGIPAD